VISLHYFILLNTMQHEMFIEH